MSYYFDIPQRTMFDTFTAVVSKGDVAKFTFNAEPWEDENSTVGSVDWSVDGGTNNAAISGETLVDGVLSALITFTQSGVSLIKIVLNGSPETKVIWLKVRVKDLRYEGDDYGYEC